MNRLCLSTALSALAASASFADAVVTNSWIYVKDQARSDERECSYWYKNQWSLETEPTADQIVEFSPSNATITKYLQLYCRDTATDKTLEKLSFPENGFTCKGLVFRYPANASTYLGFVSFSNIGYSWFEAKIGSGGVTMLGAGDAESTKAMPGIYGASPLTLTASQTWRIGSSDWKTLGTGWSLICSDLKSDSDVIWRILGKGTLQFSSIDPARSREGCTSREFGGKVFANCGLMMDGASQVSRLGTNSVEISCETVDGERAFPSLFFRFGDNADTSWAPVAFAAPLTVTATNPSIYDVGSAEITAFAIAVESKNGQRAWISFPKGISGTYGNKCLAFAGEQSGADGGGVYPGRRHSSHMRRDVARIILDGDNSGLVPQASDDRILLKTVVMPAHAHALGVNNGAILEIKMPTLWGCDGVGMVGVIASNGVTVAGALGTTGYFGNKTDGNIGVHPTVILGSEGPGTARFTGDANLVRSTQTEATDLPTSGMNVILTAEKGGRTAFDGRIRAGRYVTVNGTGDVALNNAGNVFPRALGLSVRSGRLIAGVNGALGNGPIRIGEAAARYTVRAVRTGRFPRDSTITGNAPAISADNGATPTRIVFAKDVTVDGVALKKGDKVLVASADYLVGGTVLDGVFTVTDDAARTWELDSAFDTQEGRLGLYGARIHVTEGELFAGRDFYWAEHLADRSVKPATLGSNKFAIYDDAAEHPDTGLLAADGVTVANDITVANDGTGKAEIGAATAGTAVFTGSVTVEKPTLEIYAPAGATVQVSGLLRNATGGKLTLVKTGPGKAVLAQLDATVTDIRIADGTLNFTYVDTDAVQPLLHLDAMNDASLTKVTETIGDAEVTSVTRWADTRGAAYPYVRSCRDRWEHKEADWPWVYPRNNKDWHYILTTRNPVYVVTNEADRAGVDLPVLDMLDFYGYGGNEEVNDPLSQTQQSASMDIWNGSSTIPYSTADDSPFKRIRTAFVVVKDNAGTVKQSVLGSKDSTNDEWYPRKSDGALISGANKSAPVVAGTNWLDGVEIDVTTTKLSAGFHVVSFCPTGNTTVASIGMGTQRYHGGNQYGEVILYTNEMSKTERGSIEADLMLKWLGKVSPDAPATVDSLTIDCVFKEGVMTGSLDMGSRFKPDEPCVVNVTCDAVRPEPGDYLLLSARSVETDGSDWSVNATGLAAKRDYEIVKKADGNLYLRVMARGMCIIFW